MNQSIYLHKQLVLYKWKPQNKDVGNERNRSRTAEIKFQKNNLKYENAPKIVLFQFVQIHDFHSFSHFFFVEYLKISCLVTGA